MSQDLCPCASQKQYADCCGPYIEGQKLAPHAVDLMRSRYTAFVSGAYSYLRETWHPETCPEDLGQDEPSDWIGLEIIEVSDEEDDEAEVEFKARLIFQNKLEVLHENSFFEKLEGRWLYHSGEFLNEDQSPQKIAKDAPCPCGSGKIFKKCHWK